MYYLYLFHLLLSDQIAYLCRESTSRDTKKNECFSKRMATLIYYLVEDVSINSSIYLKIFPVSLLSMTWYNLGDIILRLRVESPLWHTLYVFRLLTCVWMDIRKYSLVIRSILSTKALQREDRRWLLTYSLVLIVTELS